MQTEFILSSLRFLKLCEDFWYSIAQRQFLPAGNHRNRRNSSIAIDSFTGPSQSSITKAPHRQAGLFYEATNSTSISFPTHLLCYHASVSKTFLLGAGIIYLWFRLKAVYRPTILDEWIKHLPKNFIGPTRENKNVFTRKKHKMWA